MSASREEWQAAEDPETSGVRLAQLAQIPELQLAIAGNPAASDELLDWLIEHGSPEVRAVLDPGSSPWPAEPSEPETEPEVEVIEDVWELSGAAPESPREELRAQRAPIGRPRRQSEADKLWEEELEYRRRKSLSKEERLAEDARRDAERVAAREQADLVARADEIRRWEAAYALAHDGAMPPAGYIPPMSLNSGAARPLRNNGLAIIALVLALVGGNVVALVLGYVARGQIKRTGEGGAGLAIAAIVLGWIGVLVSAILLIWTAVLLPR